MSDDNAALISGVTALPYAGGGPPAQGILRARPDDFQVEELLGFDPSGDGEHVLLHLQKRDTNTVWLACRLASFAAVAERDVGYAGLKDRNAVTSQWFSVRLAGRPEPDWRKLEDAQIRLLAVARNRRRLRPGTLQGNRFLLRVRDLKGDLAELERRLIGIASQGAPNYFGEQRFGRDSRNLQQAVRLFAGELKRLGRAKRGLYLSAARAQLFNQVLAKRVASGDWNRSLPGDLMMLDGTHSLFSTPQPDAEISRRLRMGDIHPTGPLWGRGQLPSSGETAALESSVLEGFADWRRGLEDAGLRQARRALRAPVRALNWQFDRQQGLELRFELPAGSYATSVLRELLDKDRASDVTEIV